MALYTLTSRDEFEGLNRLPRPDQTQLFDALGRTDGANNSGDNFFTKRWKSLDNTFGTTGASVVSAIDSANENRNVEERNKKFNKSLEDIYKEAGFNNADEYYDAKDATEREIFGKYGFNSDDYWNKHADLWNPAGTNAKQVEELEAQRRRVINSMSQEDADKIRSFDAIQEKLKGQSASNANEATKAAKDWENYRTNSDVGKRINQDPGKFAGSAINTLSTMADVMLPTAGVALNSVQGAAEGLADELEQNGFENFDAKRAGQNALVGATTGAVVGGLNKGISNKLAKNNGNLFKDNFATRKLNELGSNTAAGQALSTLATGAGRGAVSGAVGGATGAGLSAAMNNQDIIGSAIEGAKQGFGQGAMAGGVMAGANMALNKTPGVGTAMQKINQASEDWKNGGDTFGERWRSARAEDTLGNRFLNNRVEDINAVKQGFKDVGEGIKTVIMDKADNLRSKYINSGAINRLASGIETGEDGTIKFARMSQSMLDDINNVRTAEGKTPMTTRQTKAVINSINNHLANHKNDFGSYEEVARAAFDVLTGDDSFAAPTNKNTNSLVLNNGENFAKSVALDDDAGIRSISPRSQKWAQKRALDRETLLNSSLEGGNGPSSQQVEPESGLPFSRSQTTNSSVPQNARNVNETPEDIQNMRINAETPETEVYRTLTSGTTSARTSWDDLAKEYGYNNYDEAVRRFSKTNPNTNANAMDVLDWLEKTPNSTSITKDAAKQRLRNIKADALRTRAAEDLLNQVGTAKAPAAKADNMIENVKQFMDEGLTKPEEWKLASDAMTGANGVMSKLHRNLIDQAGEIDTFAGKGGKYGNDINDTVDYFIKAEGLVDSDAKGVKNEIMAIIESLPSRSGGSLSMGDDASDVMSVIRELESHRRNYLGENSSNYSTTTPYKEQKARVIKKISSLLEDRIYEKVPDARTVVTQDAIQELKGYFPGNQKWAESVDKKFENIKTGKDLRSAQKRYVQTSDYLENIKQNYGTYGQKVGDVYGNALSQAVRKVPVIGGVLAQATNTPFMNRRYADINSARADILEGRPIDRVSSKNVKPTQTVNPGESVARTTEETTSQSAPETTTLPSEAQNPANTNVYNPATQIYNAIGRTEGAMNAEQARAADYLADSTQEAEIVPNTNAGTNTTSVYDTMYGTQNPNIPTFNSLEEEQQVYFFPPTGDQWTDMLSRAMKRAKDAEDYGAMDQLYEMYQSGVTNLQKQTANETQQVKLTDKQRQANAAERALNDFENVNHNFAYDISDIPVIGGIANFGGNEYTSKAEALALQLGYMLSGATVNSEEAKRIGMAYVPEPRDNEATRRAKLEQARGIISDYQQTYEG